MKRHKLAPQSFFQTVSVPCSVVEHRIMKFQDLGSTIAVGALFFLQREVICVKFFTSGAQLNILQNYLDKDLIQKLC